MQKDDFEENSTEADGIDVLWDGSIAESFAEGDGSSDSPYQIKSASQLAFLAKEVNSGKNFTEQYFSLVCDLDLNHIEWTPIGNGSNYFAGIFDGQGHTISNLKISDTIDYAQTYPHDTFQQGIAGLFGYCQNVTIRNIKIANANISTPSVEKNDQVYMGVLVANLNATSVASIENVQILNSKIQCYENSEDNDFSTSDSVTIGGVVGNAQIDASASFKMNRLHSQAVIEFLSGYSGVNIAGGIVGGVYTDGIFECSNFATSLTAYLPMNTGKNYAGAFGRMSNYVTGQVKLSSSFSEIYVNHAPKEMYRSHYYRMGAILGKPIEKAETTEIENSRWVFESLFGCVKPIDENAGFSEPICKLFEETAEGVVFTNNCQGCTALPKNHGFDETVWDVTSLSSPKLKEMN